MGLRWEGKGSSGIVVGRLGKWEEWGRCWNGRRGGIGTHILRYFLKNVDN